VKEREGGREREGGTGGEGRREREGGTEGEGRSERESKIERFASQIEKERDTDRQRSYFVEVN